MCSQPKKSNNFSSQKQLLKLVIDSKLYETGPWSHIGDRQHMQAIQIK